MSLNLDIKVETKILNLHNISLQDSTEFIVGPCKIEDVNGNQKKIELIENNKSNGYEKALLMKLIPLFKQNEKIVCV